MSAISHVLAIAGAIGSGKASLATAIAEATGCAVASFGDQVRQEVGAAGGDPTDRSELQRVGQALVLGDLKGFVARTLAQHATVGVVSGVRHWEVLDELRRQLAPRRVVLVEVQTARDRRDERLLAEPGANPRQIAAWNNDINEAQIGRVLPQYASITVNGGLPVELQVAKLRTFDFLPSPSGAAIGGVA